jgi:DNA-binding MarR family transcriptional regulator
MATEAAVDALVLAALDRGAETARALFRGAAAGALVHRALRRLEREGLVRSVPLRHARGRQRLYRLTGSGEEALALSRLAVKSLARGRVA